MSFSFNAKANTGLTEDGTTHQIVEALQAEARKSSENQDSNGTLDEYAEYVAVTLFTVEKLMDASNYLEGSVSVTVSGHVNADHEPSDSWADECVTISVNFNKTPLPVEVGSDGGPAADVG